MLDRPQGRPGRHQAHGLGRDCEPRGRGRDLSGSRCRADWTRQDRTSLAAAAEIARERSRRGRRGQAARALRRATSSASAAMSVPMPRACGNSESSASRIAPEPVPRSAIRSGACAPPIDQRERQLDHSFGFGARHQHGGRHDEGQAPELLLADDARDRLAAPGGAPPTASIVRRGLRPRALASLLSPARMIEPERVADQDARIELRRLEPGCAKLFSERAPRLRDGRAAQRDHASSAASSSA